jgi:RNA polymerase sigma factor (TIGR02999 family)
VTAVSELLERYRAGDRDALGKLVPLVYAELHRLAARYMRRERPGQTLQATALVHEAYVRLVTEKHLAATSRAHFMAIAANLMRQILVDRARARRRLKRGAAPLRVTYDESTIPAPEPPVDLIALDDALTRLEALNARQARTVELRFFAGLSVEETAEALNVSQATVKREWTVARAWLHRELDRGTDRDA